MAFKTTMIADVTDLKRGTEQAREEFKKTGDEAEKAGRKLKAVANSFDGAKVEGAARRAVSAVEKIGGVTKLTGTELTQLERKVESAIEKFRAMGSGIPPQIQKVARDIAELRAHEEDLARSTDKATAALRAQTQQAAAAARQVPSTSGLGSTLTQGVGALAGGLGVGLGAGAGLAAITSIGSAIRDLASEGARLSPLRQSFEGLQGGSQRAEQSLASLRTATRGLVSDLDLMQAANKGSLLGLDAMGIQFDEVASVATTLGRAMGQDAAKSVDDLTTALSRMSPQILDNLGIKVDLTAATEKYAASVGKSVDQLTEEEKKLAFASAAMEAAREKAAALGEAHLTVAEHGQRALTTLTDIGTEILASANESDLLTGIMGSLADTLRDTDQAWRDVIAQGAEMEGQQKKVTSETREYVTVLERYLHLQKDLDRAIAQSQFEGDLRRNPQLLEQSLAQLGTPVSGGPFNRAALAENRVGVRDYVTLMAEGAAREKEFLEQQRRAQEAAAREAEQAAARKIAAAQKYREELEKLTGQDLVAGATKLAEQLERVGVTNVLPRSLPTFVEQLQEGLARAEALGPAFADSARQIEAALRKAVTSPAYREFFQRSLVNPTIGVNRNLEEAGFARTGIAGALFPELNPFPRITGAPSLATGNTLSQGVIAGITVDFQRGLPAVRNWRTEVRGLAQSFAQLASIAGPALDEVTRGVGGVVATADVGQTLAQGLGLTDAAGNLTRGGKVLAGISAGIATGNLIGSLTANPVHAGLLGGAGGGISAALAGAGPVGIGLGIAVSAGTAVIQAARNQREQRAAIESQRQQIIASMGGFDAFRETIIRAGFSFDSFMRMFQSNDVHEFTTIVNTLNTALATQTTQATNLAKSLQAVARVQGVLSRQQLEEMRRVARRGGPNAEALVAFDEQQRAQAESGLTTAVAALSASASLTEKEIADLTRGITDEAEKLRVVEAELARRAKSTLTTFSAGAEGAAAGLFVAFSEAVRMGESAVSVLARLQKPIQELSELYKRAGIQPGAGFGQLQVANQIATGPQTGPALQLATGLGQALAGFANTGMLSPELFGELANGIGQAYKQLELFGQGGLESARLMQPALQAIWAMVDANPELRDQLDDSTKSLLDFAVQNNLVGKDFRPKIDLMIEALDRLIERIGDLIDNLDDIPDDTTTTITTEHQDVYLPPSGKPRPAPGLNYDGTPDTDGDPNTPLALGGIVTRPLRALIGEAGPEAVIPLSRLGRLGAPITITVVSQIDGYEAARAVTRWQPEVYRTYGAA